MKKLLLLCTMLLSGIGAWAAGEDYTDINSNLMYTIRNVHGFKNDGSGYKYFMMSNSNETALTGATETDFNNADNKLRCYWVFEPADDSNANAFYIKNVKTNKYLYIESAAANRVGVKLGDPQTVFYLFNGLEGLHETYGQAVYIGLQDNANNVNTSFGIHGNSSMSLWEGTGSGNQWYIESTGFATESYINEAKSIIRSGLGFPKTDSDAYRALNALTFGVSTMDDVTTAKDNYYNATDVEMPQDGKAYRISAWWENETRPFTFFESQEANVFTGQVPAYAPKAGVEGTVFACKVLENVDGDDDAYVFVSDNGYYLDWQTDDRNNTGIAYTNAFRFKIEKALISNKGAGPTTTKEQMLGKFMLRGYQEGVGNTPTNWHYLMFSKESKHFHNAAKDDRYYGKDAHTVYYILEEVPEYKTNTVKLSAQFEGESCVSTFYAPYATVLPEGYTAHKVTKVNTATVSLEEVGNEIPANTGVFVTGPANERVVLSLSTSNPTSPNDNLLDGSTVDTYVKGPAYVLANGDNGVGLYKAELNMNEAGVKVGKETGTHFKNNAGKAYLPTSAVASDACFLVFNLGDDMETGITETENGKVKTENSEVYDLSGRRVQGAQKGIFVVNGKKVVR